MEELICGHTCKPIIIIIITFLIRSKYIKARHVGMGSLFTAQLWSITHIYHTVG